jgi:hypothetical protein
MTRDDIIRMAMKAGFMSREESSAIYSSSDFDKEICCEEYAYGEIVEKFAYLVATAEREACAKAIAEVCGYGDSEDFAAIIRARGEQ